MWVPASDQCNKINIDVDTGSTGTTRQWNIKVAQYECNNLAAPTSDCLQYLTADSGISSSVNPIRVGGGLNQPALFSNVHISLKKGSGGPKFRDFS